jgi:hypothetical protein
MLDPSIFVFEYSEICSRPWHFWPPNSSPEMDHDDGDSKGRDEGGGTAMLTLPAGERWRRWCRAGCHQAPRVAGSSGVMLGEEKSWWTGGGDWVGEREGAQKAVMAANGSANHSAQSNGR